jgi:hypothetical protein
MRWCGVFVRALYRDMSRSSLLGKTFVLGVRADLFPFFGTRFQLAF